MPNNRSLLTRFGPTPTKDDEVAIKSYVDTTRTVFVSIVKSIDETIQSSQTVHNDTELFERAYDYIFKHY